MTAPRDEIEFDEDDLAPIETSMDDLASAAEGVWTLPPTFALGEKDRAKYAAIGESDRMTLKFVKPR